MGFHFRKSKKAGPFNFTLSKKGIGWSVGSKHVRFSNSATGRKSVRASIPGTGLSYSTSLGGKKKKSKLLTGKRYVRKKSTARKPAQAHTNRVIPTNSVTPTQQTRNPVPSNAPGTPNASVLPKTLDIRTILRLLCWVAFVFCAMGAIALLIAQNLGCTLYLVFAAIVCPFRPYRQFLRKIMPHIAIRIAVAVCALAIVILIYPETEQPQETEPETAATETEAEPETVLTAIAVPAPAVPETEAPETEAPETKAPETKAPETEAPETKAPETKEPETKAPETKAPETKAPETKAPETKAPETTAQTLRLVSVTSPCRNGDDATVTIIGKPNTEYSIGVYYATRASEAQGLEKKTSDANGNLSWTWSVGLNTTPSTHDITIRGGDEKLEITFDTYE